MSVIKDAAEKEKVLEKISKLIAMQTSTNPNEVAVASKLTKQLMDKYDLDMSMVKQIEEKTVTVGKEVFSVRTSNIPKWLNVLSGSIGRFYECTVLVAKGRFSFIGFELDRIVAVKFFEYLQDNIVKESIDYAYTKLPMVMELGERKSARTKFCEGATQAINIRLGDMMRERKNLTEEKGLIVIKQNEIKTWLEEEYPDLKEGGRIDFQTNMHTTRGFAYGKTIPLITTIEKNGDL